MCDSYQVRLETSGTSVVVRCLSQLIPNGSFDVAPYIKTIGYLSVCMKSLLATSDFHIFSCHSKCSHCDITQQRSEQKTNIEWILNHITLEMTTERSRKRVPQCRVDPQNTLDNGPSGFARGNGLSRILSIV